MNRIGSLTSVGFTLSMFFTALVCALMLFPHDADARRLGGGSSFGKQSSTVTQRQSSSPTTPAQQNAAPTGQPAPATPMPQPAGNRWLGPLVGVAAGLGIGALLSHFGLGGAFADGLGGILVLGLLLLAGFWLWRVLQRSVASSGPSQPQPAYAATGTAGPTVSGNDTNVFGERIGSAAAPAPSAPANPREPWGVPADFDVNGFLRVAKVNFLRLQAAWDAKNLADIREFTTPEVFAEIRMQIEESKGAADSTEVVDLDATLLGIETGPDNYLASVRFSGSMRENSTAAAPFEEVWNLTKPMDGSGGWLLAGIQQLQ